MLTCMAREKAWDDFSKGVKNLGIGAEPIDIPDMDNSAQMAEMIQTVAQKIGWWMGNEKPRFIGILG